MRLQRLPRTTALGALAVSVAFAGMAPGAAAEGGDTAAATAQERRMPAALRLAVRAVGGADDLRALRSLRYHASGQRWIFDEGVRPFGPAEPSASFEYRVRHTAASVRTPDRLRIDSVRTSLGVARPVHEVLAGRRGFIRGVDANFSAPAVKPMTSDRWAAIRKEQLLLNPHQLLRKALRNPATARNGGRRTLDGRTYRVLVLRNPVAPVRLFVDTATGRLARLRTLEHDYLRRDVLIEVLYRRWRSAGAGLSFPRVVVMRSDGERVLREVRPRAGVDANPGVRARVFRFPANLGPAPFQSRLARIGVRTSQWLLSFANLGFVKDGGQTAINPTPITDGVNTAEGVTLLGEVANNSVVVERDNGIVVLEGALHDHRAEAVIRYIRRQFPGQPITHVVTTHHHADHASGQRPYVALGATAVVHRAAVPFFRQVFRQRSSTILPDRLDRSNVPADVQGVPAAGLSLEDGQSEIDVYPIRTDHSVDMVVPFVRDPGVLFVSDIYTPGSDPGAGGQALNDLIVAQGLNVEWIVGGHGGFISYDDFLADLGQ